jgi:hypothetical protein
MSGMSEERKPIVWPWIAGAVLLPVLYVASFGPACWLASSQAWMPRKAVATCYQPLIRSCANGPNLLSEAVNWWTHRFSATEWQWGIDTAGNYHWQHIVTLHEPSGSMR